MGLRPMVRAGGGTRARRLTWAFPGCLSVPPPGHQHTLVQRITEALPPEVTAQTSLTLPPDIDQFPFSSFISSGFQVGIPRLPLFPGDSHSAPDVSPCQAEAVSPSVFPRLPPSPVMGAVDAAALLGKYTLNLNDSLSSVTQICDAKPAALPCC